jgi:rhodanese-related sulfurtransferase
MGKARKKKASKKKKSACVCSYGNINTETMDILTRSRVPLVVLDARAGPGDDGRRIPKAKQLSLETTSKQASKVIPSKKSLVIVYCANIKCPASSHLAEHLLGLGYTNILKYEGGIEEWMASGHPVLKKRKSKAA